LATQIDLLIDDHAWLSDGTEELSRDVVVKRWTVQLPFPVAPCWPDFPAQGYVEAAFTCSDEHHTCCSNLRDTVIARTVQLSLANRGISVDCYRY
jgi:hypothetical protein